MDSPPMGQFAVPRGDDWWHPAAMSHTTPDALAASLYALRTVVEALVRSHPDPASLRAAFDRHSQGAQDLLVNTRATDEQVEAVRRELALWRASLPGGEPVEEPAAGA